jgi:hypothetical protein
MTGVWALASLWLGLALVASRLAIWLRITSALSEIVVATIAQPIIGAAVFKLKWREAVAVGGCPRHFAGIGLPPLGYGSGRDAQ